MYKAVKRCQRLSGKKKTPRPDLHKVVWKRDWQEAKDELTKNRANQQRVCFSRTFTPFPSLAWEHQCWAVFRLLLPGSNRQQVRLLLYKPMNLKVMWQKSLTFHWLSGSRSVCMAEINDGVNQRSRSIIRLSAWKHPPAADEPFGSVEGWMQDLRSGMTKPGNLPRRTGALHVWPEIITSFIGSFLPWGGFIGNIFKHQYELALTASLFSGLCQVSRYSSL